MVTLDTDLKLRLLRLMLEARHADLRELSLLRQGTGHFQIAGMGHEGLAATGLLLGAEDYVFPFYRDKGLCLARGMSLRDLALSYLAKRDSGSGGRQMPGHYSDASQKIWSHPSPVASHLLPACGTAWGLRLDGKPGIVVATVGDASVRQGDFYEAACFAVEKNLPVLFVVEDNGYGISTSTRQSNPLVLEVLDARSWMRVDGADSLAVHRASAEAMDEIRAGKGPQFLWAKLERLSSHSSSDDHRNYRSEDELSGLPGHDPIGRLRAHLAEAGELTEEAFEELEAEVKEHVREVYSDALTAEDPAADEAHAHVAGPSISSEERLLEPGQYRIADVINKVLGKALLDDKRTVIFGEDVEDPKGGVFKLTKNLSSEFPDRVFNSPIAESTILGVACGLASYGRRPVFELQFVDFVHPGWNQLVSNLATLRWRSAGHWTCPAVIYAPYGAYLPAGGPWHSQANESLFAHIPGLKVAIAATPEDAAGLFWTALRDEDPVLLLLPKHLIWKEKTIEETVLPVALGSSRLVREGADVTIVAWGNGVEVAEQAAKQLGSEVEMEILDLRWVQPWDEAAVAHSVAKTGRLVVVQEDTESCSVGQMVITQVLQKPELFTALQAPPRLVSKKHVHIGFHPVLERASLPNANDLARAVREVMAIEAGRARIAAPAVAENEAPAKPVKPDSAEDAAPSGKIRAVEVPNLGEGVYEARVVSLEKQVGEEVRADDVLCEMETDKAVIPVEAPCAGKIVRWLVEEEDSVEIGSPLVEIETDEKEPAVAGEGHSFYGETVETTPVHREPVEDPRQKFVEPVLNANITDRARKIVLTNIVVTTRWHAIRAARKEAKKRKLAVSPSVMTAWCVVQAMKDHPAFCRLMQENGRLLQPDFFDFGVAVALEEDRLETGVIPEVNQLAWTGFVDGYQAAIEAARESRGGSKSRTPLILTSMGAMGVRFGMPIVVPPGMATLFVGSAFYELMPPDDDPEGEPKPQEVVTLSLTFDHRVANGAGASAFIRDVRKQIETFTLPEE